KRGTSARGRRSRSGLGRRNALSEEQRSESERGKNRKCGAKPVDTGVAVGLERSFARLRAGAGLVECRLQIRIRHERHAPGYLHLRLRLRLLRDRRTVLDVGDK